MKTKKLNGSTVKDKEELCDEIKNKEKELNFIDKMESWSSAIDYINREIKPKTINDKIYLILKNNGKPMHFAEIAEKINLVGFDNKKANAATVHNELILDEKYILVGRGIYSLKEWGYEKGTVAEVIEKVIRHAGQPLARGELINLVLKQRLVKKATINLALMNRARFELTPDGKYNIKTKRT